MLTENDINKSSESVSLLCAIKQQYNQQKCRGLMLHKATGQ